MSATSRPRQLLIFRNGDKQQEKSLTQQKAPANRPLLANGTTTQPQPPLPSAVGAHGASPVEQCHSTPDAAGEQVTESEVPPQPCVQPWARTSRSRLVASQPSASATAQLGASPTRDWSAPLMPPPSPALYAIHTRGLYAVRSHFHSLLAYEEADGDSGGCYALSRYPAQPHDTFPSVFSVTIALSGHVAAVYVVDALLQHRLQVSGGRLMAWKGGERRDRKKKASRAANTARAARRQRRAAQSGKEGCSDDSTDSDSESAVRATAALHSIDSAELSAGLTFHALSAEPASPRSPLFYLFDPLTSRFLSAKRDGRVTVRVSRKTCNEQWRLLALAELGFHSQQHAAAARTQWLETRTRQRHEQREAEESEAYIGRWPEHLVVGRERLAVWRDEVRGVSRASYSQCGGNDAKRLLTLHFDYTQRQAPADDKGGDSAVSRFSANGMSMRMQPTAVQWRATHPVKQRGSGLEEQAEGVTGRAGKQTAVSSAPAASWDPLADVKLEGRALQLTWRQDIAHTLERVSEYDEQLDQQQQQQRHDGRRLTDAASPSRTSHSDTAQPSSPSSPLTRPSTPLVSPSSPLACPSLSPLPPLLSADSSICSPPSVSPATCKTALLLRSRSGVARPSLLSQSSVRGSTAAAPVRVSQSLVKAAVGVQCRKRLKKLAGESEDEVQDSVESEQESKEM